MQWLFAAVPDLQPPERRREAMSLEADYESVKGQLDALRAALADGTASDGYHSFNELYHYRMLYNACTALAFDGVGWSVVRSRRHSSGAIIFGGPWFVVHMETPAGQITNHYRAEYWRLFDGIEEVDKAPAWDLHTPEIARLRLQAAVTFLREAIEQRRNHLDLMKRATARVRMEEQSKYITACTGCETCSYCTGKMTRDAPPMRDDS